jgi:hypothetical protein
MPPCSAVRGTDRFVEPASHRPGNVEQARPTIAARTTEDRWRELAPSQAPQAGLVVARQSRSRKELYFPRGAFVADFIVDLSADRMTVRIIEFSAVAPFLLFKTLSTMSFRSLSFMFFKAATPKAMSLFVAI